MTLDDYRQMIDQADSALIKAFCDRMDVAAKIAAYKKEHGLPVLDTGREQAKLRAVAEQAGPEMEDYTTVLYALLFEGCLRSSAYASADEHVYGAVRKKPGQGFMAVPV